MMRNYEYGSNDLAAYLNVHIIRDSLSLIEEAASNEDPSD